MVGLASTCTTAVDHSFYVLLWCVMHRTTINIDLFSWLLWQQFQLIRRLLSQANYHNNYPRIYLFDIFKGMHILLSACSYHFLSITTTICNNACRDSGDSSHTSYTGSSGSALQIGIIVGIIVGSVIVIPALCFLIYKCYSDPELPGIFYAIIWK